MLTGVSLRAGGFIVSEAPGYRSREIITVVSGANVTGTPLKAGTVLGRITASGKYTVYDPGTDPADGSEAAAVAILYDQVDAGAADVKAVAIVRDAEVNQGELTWFSGASGGEITTGIASLATRTGSLGGIICRPSVPA